MRAMTVAKEPTWNYEPTPSMAFALPVGVILSWVTPSIFLIGIAGWLNFHMPDWAFGLARLAMFITLAVVWLYCRKIDGVQVRVKEILDQELGAPTGNWTINQSASYARLGDAVRREIWKMANPAFISFDGKQMEMIALCVARTVKSNTVEYTNLLGWLKNERPGEQP